MKTVKVKVSFLQTTKDADECENLVINAIEKANGLTLEKAGEPAVSTIGLKRNIDTYFEVTDSEPEDDDRTEKGRINETLMGKADCRVHVVDN